MNVINFNNVSFSYEDNLVFKGVDICFSGYNNYSIVGTSSSGKSTLLKLLNRSFKVNSGNILINNEEINQIDNINKYVISVFDDEIYIRDTLKEEMMFSLENLGYPPREIMSKINYLFKYFDLEYLKDNNISLLNKEERIIVKILSYIVLNPIVIAFDDLFKWLSKDFKEKLISYLKENNITLINVVSSLEDALFTEYIYVFMENGKVACEGKTIPVLKEEKLLKRLGFSLPFMIDLSIQLQYYNLIDDVYINKRELIDKIWK